jgi:hypothetical protein
VEFKYTVSKGIGNKQDQDKPMVSLVDPDWLMDVSHVLTFGMNKYAKDNWKHVENAQDRYLSAAYRHLLAYQGGEINDPESGLPHLAHASCCLMFLHYFSEGEGA